MFSYSRHRWYRRSTLVSLVLLLSFVIGCAGLPQVAVPAAIAPEATVVLEPGSIAPDETITISGSGFVPGEIVVCRLVAAWDGTTDIGVGPGKGEVIEANASRAFSATWKFRGHQPKHIAPGVYTLEARGRQGTVATAPLLVLKKVE